MHRALIKIEISIYGDIVGATELNDRVRTHERTGTCYKRAISAETKYALGSECDCTIYRYCTSVCERYVSGCRYAQVA